MRRDIFMLGAASHALHAVQEAPEEGAGLAISGGQQGARLTHSHARQYAYVLQSLMLWCALLLAPAQREDRGALSRNCSLACQLML